MLRLDSYYLELNRTPRPIVIDPKVPKFAASTTASTSSEGRGLSLAGREIVEKDSYS